MFEPQKGMNIDELDLPDESRVVRVYSDEEMMFVDDVIELKKSDDVAVLTT